jgi:hypothetical protein
MRIKKLQKSMRSGFLNCGLVLAISASVLTAQTKPIQTTARTQRLPSVSPRTDSPQLINPDDGLAILGAALEGRYKTERRSDCSHLVHAIYEKAGFPYKYQRSTDLYAGVEEFRRVNRPQPGDLIVWIGHAGIVVSPAKHTFYSALRSGFGMQPYDSPYWRGRGRPHFFRYLKATSHTELAAKRSPALTATGLRDSSETDPPDPESVPARPATPKPATAQLANSKSATPQAKSELAQNRDPDEDAANTAPTDAQPATPPRTVVIYATRLKPDQVSNALREQFQAFADTLETRDLLAVAPSVISFDHLEIQKLQTKGDSGHAQLHLRGAVDLAQAGAESKSAKGRDHIELLPLHRAKGGWEVTLPSNAVYVPRQTAVRILAHRLASLSDDANQPDTKDGQKVELARWLNALLENR